VSSLTILFMTLEEFHCPHPVTGAPKISPQDQYVWIHLFLVILISTSLFVVSILRERDTARTNIERYG
jgi:hypothetical protein